MPVVVEAVVDVTWPFMETAPAIKSKIVVATTMVCLTEVTFPSGSNHPENGCSPVGGDHRDRQDRVRTLPMNALMIS